MSYFASSSYALTASLATSASAITFVPVSASFAINSNTSSFAMVATTASFVVSASFSNTSSFSGVTDSLMISGVIYSTDSASALSANQLIVYKNTLDTGSIIGDNTGVIGGYGPMSIMPDSHKFYYRVQSYSGSWYYINSPLTSSYQGSTVTTQSFDSGYYMRIASPASTASSSGFFILPNTKVSLNQNPVIWTKIRGGPTSGELTQAWFGLSTTVQSSSVADRPGAKFIGHYFGLSGAQHGIAYDGVTTVTTTQIPVNIFTPINHEMVLRMRISGSVAYFSINNSAECSLTIPTNLLGSTNQLFYQASAVSLGNGINGAFNMGYVHCEYGGVNAFFV